MEGIVRTEIGPVLGEVADTHAHIDKWAKPTKPPFSLLTQPMRRVVYKEGKGVCLIIGPFNYPLSMCFNPLVSSLKLYRILRLHRTDLCNCGWEHCRIETVRINTSDVFALRRTLSEIC